MFLCWLLKVCGLLINKLSQIAREEEKALVLGDQKRISAIELRQLNRTYELEDRSALIEKTATNGAWTSAGQFTVSYLVDYERELEDTVPLFEYDLENDSFGIPTIIDIGTYTGGFIDVKKYKRLDIELVATNNVSFILEELIGIDWEEVGTVTTENTIVKSYSLVNTNIIKIVRLLVMLYLLRLILVHLPLTQEILATPTL